MNDNGNHIPQRTYQFNVKVGNQVAQLTIPDDQMKACRCGCDLFDLKYRVTHVKPPVIGAEPVICAAPIYVCSKCRTEVTPETPTKAAAKELQPHELKRVT